jgi:mono/diheme cytochrome c family protein
MRKRSRLLWAILAAVGVCGWTQAATERDKAAGQDKAIERGNAHYLLFCANCHGVDADGKGPLVGLLKVVPSNLTTLKQTGNGESVTERVLKAVAGRHPVGPGGHRMPVFSDNLEMRTVIEIGAYLDSIQK